MVIREKGSRDGEETLGILLSPFPTKIPRQESTAPSSWVFIQTEDQPKQTE
jgi:hypothetical protein